MKSQSSSGNKGGVPERAGRAEAEPGVSEATNVRRMAVGIKMQGMDGEGEARSHEERRKLRKNLSALGTEAERANGGGRLTMKESRGTGMGRGDKWGSIQFSREMRRVGVSG